MQPPWHIGLRLDDGEIRQRWFITFVVLAANAGHHRAEANLQLFIERYGGWGVFVAALLCIGLTGYAINFGEMGKTLNKRFLKTALAKEIQRHPNDSRLYTMLGSIHYQDKAYPEAIEAYERSLRLEADNPETLNNLAWLYATCEERKWREPVKALVYAVHAAALKPVPHILDTLAESYYVNGLYEKAVATIKRALAMEPEDRAYYESQLRKFEEAHYPNE